MKRSTPPRQDFRDASRRAMRRARQRRCSCARSRLSAATRSSGSRRARRRRRAQGEARDKLAAALTEATAARNAAVRDATAWREKAPDEARFAALQACRRGCRRLQLQRPSEELAEPAPHRGRHRRRAEGRPRRRRRARALAELDRCLRRGRRARAATSQEEARAPCSFSPRAGGGRQRDARPLRQAGHRAARRPICNSCSRRRALVLRRRLAPQALQRAARRRNRAPRATARRSSSRVLVRLGFARLLAETGNAGAAHPRRRAGLCRR